jgi:hypothetical protein
MSTNGNTKKNKRKGRGKGGFRKGSGRPRGKLRKSTDSNYVQVTTLLRKDTLAQLRAATGGGQRFFGEVLQWQLDRCPIPTHEEYLAIKNRKPVLGPARRKIPVVYANSKPPRKIRDENLADLPPQEKRFIEQFKPL